MSAIELLSDIKQFIEAASRDNLTEAERVSLRFSNGAEIVDAIDEILGNPQLEIIEDFDPYTDPETVAMLELGGIATYRHRLRRYQ